MEQILTNVVTAIITIVFGITAISLFKEKKGKNDAEIVKKESKDELEKMSADDIAADSPNPDTISGNVEQEQEELRQRLRDRFKKNIQWAGSSIDN